MMVCAPRLAFDNRAEQRVQQCRQWPRPPCTRLSLTLELFLVLASCGLQQQEQVQWYRHRFQEQEVQLSSGMSRRRTGSCGTPV